MAKPVFQIAERAGLWTYGDDGELREATEFEVQQAEALGDEATELVVDGEPVSQAKLTASYTIAVQDTIADLVAQVCDLVTDGWIPIGAPFYVNRPMDGTGWHQALFMGER